ncbi:multiprotein-bridging factor 1 family protein [Streptomyces sp. NPDC057702]|uniref:helix-turn-helix domain-containing protein n=1 Tax=unclassified Streptomyces TaxID=2593676 RepID=UPI0036BB60E3
MPEHSDTPPPQTFGQRVREARENTGRTRPVVGGLVGRSPEWVKAIETGRLGIPRLPLLLRLADVLDVEMADLTGDERLATSSYTKGAHRSLPLVRAALTRYHLAPTTEPEAVSVLRARVRRAWATWHAAGEHRTAVAEILPALLTDLQKAARAYDGTDRRRVLVALTEALHLAQLFLAFQPAPELVMLASDRAMTVAQDADSPRAMASAAWYMGHTFRGTGDRHEARVDLAMQAAGLLRGGTDPEDVARKGLLQLAVALSYAKLGRRGDAERHWDRAGEAAKRLGDGYAHPYLIFGRGMVDAYAITLYADLPHGREAVRAAEAVDLGPVPSATRRSFHMIETARAYSLQREPVATVHMLKRAYHESPETARFNAFTRSAVTDLAETGPALIREEARSLRLKLGLLPAA